MAPPDPKRPVVEAPPDTSPEPKISDRAVRARIRQQEILAELGVIALRSTPLEELLAEAVRMAAEGLEAEFSKVLEYIPAENRFLLRTGVGWDEGLVGAATVGADLESPAGYALRTGKPVISNQLENEERFRTPELLALHGVRRAINVILQGDGAPFGVLEVDSRSEGDFSEKDIAFLQGTANIIGMAIERQRYESNLKAALEHQHVLVKEINHRVKNSLQLVSSMLNLRASAQADPGISQALGEASARVAAISRAHDRLYRSFDVARIELAGYLSEVCRDLMDVMPTCIVDFQATATVQMTTDSAIRLALLVTELVTNAAKHAYGGSGGPIHVQLSLKDQGTVSISVRDEGRGLAKDFAVERPTGLGMRLVKALTDQMEAVLRIEPSDRGTTFTIDARLEPS
jgi:two-component sensor histidine kinase